MSPALPKTASTTTRDRVHCGTVLFLSPREGTYVTAKESDGNCYRQLWLYNRYTFTPVCVLSGTEDPNDVDQQNKYRKTHI